MITRFSGALSVLLVASLMGCTSSDPGAADRQSSNLKPLAVLYGVYLREHRGQPPANEEEFKTWVRNYDAKKREAVGAKDAESIFVSSRDNKPYKFVFGGSQTHDAVVVYEQEGVNGKRYVGTSVGNVEELDEATFRQRVPSAQ